MSVDFIVQFSCSWIKFNVGDDCHILCQSNSLCNNLRMYYSIFTNSLLYQVLSLFHTELSSMYKALVVASAIDKS